MKQLKIIAECEELLKVRGLELSLYTVKVISSKRIVLMRNGKPVYECIQLKSKKYALFRSA